MVAGSPGSDHSDLQWPCILSLLWLHTQGAALHPTNSISSPPGQPLCVCASVCVCLCVFVCVCVYERVHKEELIKQLLKRTSCTQADCNNLLKGADQDVDQFVVVVQLWNCMAVLGWNLFYCSANWKSAADSCREKWTAPATYFSQDSRCRPAIKNQCINEAETWRSSVSAGWEGGGMSTLQVHLVYEAISWFVFTTVHCSSKPNIFYIHDLHVWSMCLSPYCRQLHSRSE